MATEGFTLEQAEDHIGDVRGLVDRLGEAHSIDDSVDIPDSPATGHTIFATAGHLRYASGVTGDSNYYATGRNTNPATGALNLTTSLQVVPGMSCSVGIGTYHVRAQVLLSAAANGGVVHYAFAGSATVSNGRYSCIELNGTNTGSLNGVAVWTTFGSQVNATSPGATPVDRTTLMDGIFIVSVAGSIQVQVSQSATANSTVVQYGSYIECMPVL